MQSKTTLESYNKILTQNYYDEAYNECRIFSQKTSHDFLKLFPYLKRYKKIFAKIVFVESYNNFLYNKFLTINGQKATTNKLTNKNFFELLAFNLNTLRFLILNLCKLALIFLISKKQRPFAPKLGIELAEGLRPEIYRSDLNFNLEEFGFANLVLFDFQNVIPRYGKSELQILEKIVKKGTTIVTDKNLPSTIAHKKVTPPYIRGLKISKLTKINLTFLFLSYVPFIIISEIFWSKLFSNFNIKGWLHTTEEPMENLIQSLVMEKLNGISFSRQRSDQANAEGMYFYPSDILFTWSRHSIEHFKKYNDNLVLRPIGHNYLYYKKLDAIKNFSKSVKNKFPPNQYIISFFDNVIGDTFELSKENFEDLIRFFIQLLNEYPQVSLVFKLKKTIFIKQYPFQNEISDLVDRKRIIIYDGYLLSSSLGFASNLSIGTAGSSSVMEILVAGQRGILFWPAPNTDHPFSRSQFENVVFRNLENLKNAIIDSITNPQSSVGHISSENLYFIDEFCDLNAPCRMSYCLKKLIRENPNRKTYLSWIKSNDLSILNDVN